MGDAATPAENKGGIPPTPPAATPAPAASTAAAPEGFVLTFKTKEEMDLFQTNAARASEAQSRADRFEGILKKNGLLGVGHFKPAPLATPPTPEELQAAGAAEDEKAKQGLMGLALDPVYREVLDKEPLLRDLLVKNPLAVLPILAADALDADDAVSLVKEALNKRKPVPTATMPTVPATSTTSVTPPVGGVNTQDKPVNEEVEAARKNPNTERAIAGMVGARLKENAGKK